MDVERRERREEREGSDGAGTFLPDLSACEGVAMERRRERRERREEAGWRRPRTCTAKGRERGRMR